MLHIQVVPIVFFLAFVISYIVNWVQFTSCDFKSDYRCEAIHFVELVPPASIITVWYAVDDETVVVEAPSK